MNSKNYIFSLFIYFAYDNIRKDSKALINLLESDEGR